MRSSNTQILDDLRRYRQVASKVSPQEERNIRNILQARVDEMVEQEAQRRRDQIAVFEPLVSRHGELTKAKESIAREIKAKEEKIRELEDSINKQTVSEKTKLANLERNIHLQLEQNFDQQIRAMRIRDTGNTEGQAFLGGKTLEALQTEEKALRQELADAKTQAQAREQETLANNPLVAELEAVKKEKGKLENQRNNYSHELKQILEQLKEHGFGKDPIAAFRIYKRNHNPDDASSAVHGENLLEHLSASDKTAVEDFLNALATVSANANIPNTSINSCQFPHLYRVLFTALPNHFHAYYYVGSSKVSRRGDFKEMAEGLGPSVVADNFLEDILENNYQWEKTPFYTFYQELTGAFAIIWHRDEKQVLPLYEGEEVAGACEPYAVVNEYLLTALEKILTQDPEISFPDLAIQLTQAVPHYAGKEKILESLQELKRLHEETPEQVLVTEQRYYREKELQQLKENARLEREEIARQAELDREQAAYIAEQDRRAMEEQARLDREQAEMAAYRAEQLQAEHNRAMERAERSRAQAEERARKDAERARRDAERDARREKSENYSRAMAQCRVCANFSGCRNTGVYGCGSFVPRR